MNYSAKEIELEYQRLYDQKFGELTGDNKKKEREAQKYVIKNLAFNLFGSATPTGISEIWNQIYAAHVSRKTGVLITKEVADKVIKAAQSWKSASGHAFQEIVSEQGNRALRGTGIELASQKDTKSLMDSGKLLNEKPDLDWLKESIKKSDFDLFVLKDSKVFGCVQVKTSIRDRVTRDREPSSRAMAKFFWSIIFVLDGTMLKYPKYKSMVNGKSEGFSMNGWHSMYALSTSPSVVGDRIFLLDYEWSLLKIHAEVAAKDWQERRQWLNSDWSQPNHYI